MKETELHTLVTTAIPTKGDVTGLLIVEGVSVTNDIVNPFRYQCSWNSKAGKITSAKVLVNEAVQDIGELKLIDHNGQCAVLLPGVNHKLVTVAYVSPYRNMILPLGWSIISITTETSNTMSVLANFDTVTPFTNINMEVPVGVPIPWVTGAVPKGFLPYTGNLFDPVYYPELGKLYPTGILPNLTGDVLRAAEVGRTVMSKQGQSVQPLTYEKFTSVNSTMTSSVSVGTHAVPTGNWTPLLATGDAYKWKGGLRFMNGAINIGGPETRMANTAVLYITRAA